MRGPKLFLSFGNADVAGSSGFGICGSRHLLVVVAQAEVQRRPRVEPPRVLDEEVVVEGVERERRRADALAEAGVVASRRRRAACAA